METKQAIEEMIDKLRKLRQRSPQRIAFGDANWEQIDGQIEALEWVLGDSDPPVSDEDLK